MNSVFIYYVQLIAEVIEKKLNSPVKLGRKGADLGMEDNKL